MHSMYSNARYLMHSMYSNARYLMHSMYSNAVYERLKSGMTFSIVQDAVGFRTVWQMQ